MRKAQNKLTFDVTPTDGSINPVTSDGISAVLKKKCSIVSEITVAEQTNLSNPVDRGIYIIKKTDSTSTTPEYGSVDSFGVGCLLPHLAIYYKDSDGVFKHAHLPIGETKSYTSITISSNILTLTKNDGSVETITLPLVDSTGNDIESTYATKTELANYLPLSGGTLTGDLLFSNVGTATNGIYGSVGSYNDGWRLVGGVSAANNSGWLELATGDDGDEPIYVRQYTYASGPYPYCYFGKLVRTATLLDASGNTSFPGTVTASAFSGNAATATKLATARSITLSGNTTGTATFDGSANVTIATSTSYATAAGNATTSYSSNYIKSNKWNWSGVGPQGTGSTVRKIASITDMSYLEIDGVNSVGTDTKGIVKISIAYINGIIISNKSTESTNFGYVITSTTSGNNGKVNIDLYLQERSGENYYNILVSKLVGSAISFESPSAAAITAPSGYVAIS